MELRSKAVFFVLAMVFAAGCLCCDTNYVSKDEMLSYCNQIPDADGKQTCIGMASEDSSPCAQLQSQSSRDFCLKWVARAIPDEKICASVADANNKNWCYYSVAAISKNSEICYQIANQGIAQLCIAHVDRDSSVCDSYGWETQDMKLRCKGVVEGDSSYCDRITSAGWKSDCNYYVGLKTGAIGFCTYYSKTDVPWCYGIVGHKTMSTDVCKGLSEADASYCKAMANGNPVECSPIINQTTRGNCYRNAVGIQKGAYDE